MQKPTPASLSEHNNILFSSSPNPPLSTLPTTFVAWRPTSHVSSSPFHVVPTRRIAF